MEDQKHEHRWKVDYSLPTSDVNPVHRAVFCECGATACREDETGHIHDLREPDDETKAAEAFAERAWSGNS